MNLTHPLRAQIGNLLCRRLAAGAAAAFMAAGLLPASAYCPLSPPGGERARVRGSFTAFCFHSMFGVRRSMFDVPSFRLACGILLTLLAGLASASAQSNRVPGPADFTAFARYITDRNIFDPMRYGPVSRPVFNGRRSDPMFTLVGTLSYGKGMFAFFDGNNPELRQALAVSGSVAGYTVREITLTGVTLQGPHTNQVIALKVGDSMRQVAGVWQFAGQSELTGGTGERGSREQTESAPETPVVLPTTGEQGDILKRLAQKRQQEEK